MTRWPTKPLGEVCELVNGRPFKPHEWEEAGLPIIRIQNLTDRTKPFNYTTQALPEKFKVMRGDTLLSWSGTPGTSFGCFRWDGPEGWLNQHIFNVHLDDEVLPPFFIYQVNSKLDELIAKAHGGVGLQHITKGALSSVNVTVPPLAEQERIVKLLDEADELRKLRAQADHRTAALIPSLFHEMFGDPLGSSKGCQIEKLGAVTTFITSGSRGWAQYYSETGARFIRVQNLEGHHLSFEDVAHVNPPDTAETRRTRVQSNDLLLAITGNTIGLSALAPDDVGEAYVSQHVAIIRLNRHVVSPYVASFMALPTGGQHQIAQMQYGHTKPGISLQQIREMDMPLPPLPLQKEFAARVSEIRALQAEQSASRCRLDDLFQSLLHRAFQGEL